VRRLAGGAHRGDGDAAPLRVKRRDG
jgi:hypothetical protein